MDDYEMYKELNKKLKYHGSWLYGGEKPRVDLNVIFNPSSALFNTMPMRQRMLIVKELLFCGVDLASIESFLNSFTAVDEQTLRGIFEDASAQEYASLDIQYPLNWFRGQEAGFYHDQNTFDGREGGPSYLIIIGGLEVMTSQLFEQLISQPDTLMRKRLVYLEHSLTRPSTRIFPNDEPVMDGVEDRLLEQIGSYPPETRAGYGVMELLAEDIHDELDEEYRREKVERVNRLFAAIEDMDMTALENLRSSFRSTRIAPKGQREAPSKEWLYENVWNVAIRRELSKLREVEFVLKPMPKLGEK